MSERNAKRVLLVSRNMPPLVGGMERLNWHAVDELAKRGPVTVVAPRGAAAFAPAGIQFVEVPGKPLAAFLAASALQSIRAARRVQPDVVVAGSGLMAPAAEVAAAATGAACMAYVHGLDVLIKNRAYRSLWLPSIRRMDRLVANSGFTADACVRIGARSDRIGVVHPGVGPVTASGGRDHAGQAFRERYGLGDGLCLISIGRLTARKGLREFVSAVLPLIVAELPTARFVLVGGEASDALHANGHSAHELVCIAEASGVIDNLRIVGRLDDQEIEGAWAASDVHVFPVLNIPGDPEGFGMVAIEAAARGIPTVAYAVGGVPDAVEDGVSGALVQEGDALAFAAAVLKAGVGAYQAGAMHAHAAKFGWGRFGELLAEQVDLAIASATR